MTSATCLQGRQTTNVGMRSTLGGRAALGPSRAPFSVKNRAKPIAVTTFASAAHFFSKRFSSNRVASTAGAVRVFESAPAFSPSQSSTRFNKMAKRSVAAEAFKMSKICIVGGGNAAHAMAALFPFKGIPCNMLVTFGDESERINAGLDAQGQIEATFDHHNDPGGLVTGRPDKVSKSAADVVPECNVIIMPLPSFAYRSVLEELKPHLKPGIYIGVTPGQGGFDWIARDVLGDLVDEVVFFAIMPMPFNCRITDFGKKVAVQEFKRHYRVGTIPADKSADAISICEQLFGHTESCGHFLSTTLYPINAIIHPQRLFAICNPKGGEPWVPGKSFPENPLFYESFDDFSAEMMDLVNQELIQIGKGLAKAGMEVDVPHIYDFLAKFVYEDKECTDLKSFFRGNAAYKGFRCPFKQCDNGEGWEPDFKNRYFTEDIPFGLCIYKGVADIVGVETPYMDKVLYWVQGYMGKEYIVDGKLRGKDVGETSAPQRWGIFTVEGLNSGAASASRAV